MWSLQFFVKQKLKLLKKIRTLVNSGFNINICWHTQPIFWLAFALPSDFASAWSWNSSFWNWQ